MSTTEGTMKTTTEGTTMKREGLTVEEARGVATVAEIVRTYDVSRIEADAENAGGKVGAIDPLLVAGARRALEGLGYEVSVSRDEDGVTWIWWWASEAAHATAMELIAESVTTGLPVTAGYMSALAVALDVIGARTGGGRLVDRPLEFAGRHDGVTWHVTLAR